MGTFVPRAEPYAVLAGKRAKLPASAGRASKYANSEALQEGASGYFCTGGRTIRSYIWLINHSAESGRFSAGRELLDVGAGHAQGHRICAAAAGRIRMSPALDRPVPRS